MAQKQCVSLQKEHNIDVCCWVFPASVRMEFLAVSQCWRRS